MSKKELLKLWNSYYLINTGSSIVPLIAIVAFAYLFLCDIISFEHMLIFVSVILLAALITLMITFEKVKKLTTNKNNLNAFLQIAVDGFKGEIFYSKKGKRKINKQMAFVSNLKELLKQFNCTGNENRKILYDFIDNDYCLKNEDIFIQLCQNCLASKQKQQNSIDEGSIDKTSILIMCFRFVLLQFKFGMLCAMIVALCMVFILAFCEPLSRELPCCIECLNKLLEHKEAIDTANTIVFDIAAIVLVYFEIKQEEIK